MRQVTYEDFTGEVAVEGLASGSLFGALSTDATRFLLKRGKIYALSAGDTVYEYGARGDRFYIVCRGAIDFLKFHNGEFHHIRTAGFGQEVGFVAMIDLHPEGGTAVAKEDSLVLQVSYDLFNELHQTYPLDFGLITLNLARDMARVISRLGAELIESSAQQ